MTISRPLLPPLQMHVHPPVPLVSGLRCDQEQDRSRALRPLAPAAIVGPPQATLRREQPADAPAPVVPARAALDVSDSAVTALLLSACAHDANSDSSPRAGRVPLSRLSAPALRLSAPASRLQSPASCLLAPASCFRAHPGLASLQKGSLRKASPVSAIEPRRIASNSGSRPAPGSDRSGEEVT